MSVPAIEATISVSEATEAPEAEASSLSQPSHPESEIQIETQSESESESEIEIITEITPESQTQTQTQSSAPPSETRTEILTPLEPQTQTLPATEPTLPIQTHISSEIETGTGTLTSLDTQFQSQSQSQSQSQPSQPSQYIEPAEAIQPTPTPIQSSQPTPIQPTPIQPSEQTLLKALSSLLTSLSLASSTFDPNAPPGLSKPQSHPPKPKPKPKPQSAPAPPPGTSKLRTLLLAQNPSWVLSEKRVKRVLGVLRGAGGIANGGNGNGVGNGGGGKEDGKEEEEETYPRYRINESLRVDRWSSKIKVHDFGRGKGKGLVASEGIEKGESVWKEDPFVIAPEWEIWDAQQEGVACMHCTTSLLPPSPLHKPCSPPPSSLFAKDKTEECGARFCSLLCKSRAQNTHPLLCPRMNPACVPFLRWVRGTGWRAPFGLAVWSSRCILCSERERGGGGGRGGGREEKKREEEREEREVWDGMAVISFPRLRAFSNKPPLDPFWNKIYTLYTEAFRTPVETQQLKRLVRYPIVPDRVPELYDYEAFLRGVGRMNLNMESHGGLYILHSHLNHSCEPNMSVRHFDQRLNLARITLVAMRRIEPGEELTITYVDPSLGVKERQSMLREWNIGECGCVRCVREMEGGANTNEVPNPNPDVKIPTRPHLDTKDLERELRMGFGL